MNYIFFNEKEKYDVIFVQGKNFVGNMNIRSKPMNKHINI